LCCYFTAYFALCTALEPTEQAVLCLGTGFVLERALSGLSVASFPLAKDTGLAHTFAKAADKSRVKITLLLLSALIIALQGLFCGVMGIAYAAVALIVFGLYRFTAVREFGGITGDLAGWFLQKYELWQLAAVVICQIILRRAVI
jgi:adenosylcobinamide-GDP ribazoletransferase